MRLAVVGPAYPFRGGIAHYTALLAGHLSLTHDVLLVSFTEQYPRFLFPGRTDRDPSAAAVAVEPQRLLAPLRPWTWWSAARRVADHRPVVVLLQWWVPFWAPCFAALATLIKRRCGARVIFVCHNVLPHDSDGAAIRGLTRLALGRGDGFIVHSRADETALRELLPGKVRSENVRLAPLPEFDIAAPVGRADARRLLALDDAHPVALFFGFVRPYKGLAYLLEALPAVRREVPAIRVIVAGEFWEAPDAYLRKIDELDLGSVVTIEDDYVPNEEVGKYFAAADVVVLPYVSATQSAVVTIASRFGCPVITTSVGGLPDVVIDGWNGLVVTPRDADALAGAMIRFFSDAELRARLRSGVLQSRDRFEWARIDLVVLSLAGAQSGRC